MSYCDMLSLWECVCKIKNLEGIEKKSDNTVYLYDSVSDNYYTINNIRIDSENDIVIDISR